MASRTRPPGPLLLVDGAETIWNEVFAALVMPLSNKAYLDPLRRQVTKHPLVFQVLGLAVSLILIILGASWLLQSQHSAPAENENASTMVLDVEEPRVLTPLEERQRLHEILEKAISAQGGRIFVDRLLTVKKTGVLVQEGSTMNAVYAFKRPNRVRYRLEQDERGFRFGYDGALAWRQLYRSGHLAPAEPLPEDEAPGLVLTSELAVPAVLFFEESRYMSIVGTEEVEGHSCFVLDYVGPLRAAQRFYIDKDSHLLRQRTRQARLRGEDTTLVEVIYSDFRAVDGIEFPFLETVLFDGEVQTVFEIENFIINPGILDEFFEMPGDG